jgi:hypothetical protein
MSKWYCSIPAAHPSDPPRTVIVESAAAFDAKQYAQRLLGAEGLLFQETGEDAIADYALRWVGDDYNAGATPNARRLEVRERKGSGWGEWRRADG